MVLAAIHDNKLHNESQMQHMVYTKHLDIY